MSPVQNSTFSVPRQDTNLSADNMATMFDVGHVSAFQKETFQREWRRFWVEVGVYLSVWKAYHYVDFFNVGVSGEASRPEDEDTEEKEDEMLNDKDWEYVETNEGGKL